MNKCEILSPAGSRESLEAAVRSGADAVYLGATEFSARRNAENFDSRQLADAVKFCKIRGVRVYLALNILLSEKELYIAIEIARTACRAGIDAVIVQDLGLARLLHTALPELPIHASTQMSVHSPSALPALKSLGITQVVAAREMTASELKELCAAARELDMTVEVFVHGALCMSVSGQCLMSAVLGGRSGNRGLCAGPCRLPFGVPNGTGYDLSLKDLSLLPHLKSLADMGVTSFKIEGRMKRPEYVAAATAAARAALDTGVIPEALARALHEVFSRSGFTDGYFTGKMGRRMFGIRTKDDVTAAAMAIPMLHELYRSERQSVEIKLKAEIIKGKASRLTVFDGVNTVAVEGAVPQQAANRALDEQTVKTALEKLGSTPFKASETVIVLDEGQFLRGADLNALRRDAVAQLIAVRSEIPERLEAEYKFSVKECSHLNRPSLIVRVEKAEQIPNELGNISALMYPLEAELPQALPEKIKLIVDIPRGMTDEESFKNRLGRFKKAGFSAAWCGNLAAVELAKKCGLEVIAGIGMNVYNRETVDVLRELGVASVTLSPELRMNEAVKMRTSLPKGIFAYGRLPLMLTRNCPAANGHSCAECDGKTCLTDRKQVQFPVRCRAGFAEVLNSLPIYIGDKLNDTAGLDFLLLYFPDEDPDTVARTIIAYKRGAAVRGDGFTRGLYYRTTL